MAWLEWLANPELDMPVIRLLGSRLPEVLVRRIVLSARQVENVSETQLWQRLNPSDWQASQLTWLSSEVAESLADLNQQLQTAQASLHQSDTLWSLGVDAFWEGASTIGFIDDRWPDSTQHEQRLVLQQFVQLLRQLDDDASSESSSKESNYLQRFERLEAMANDSQADFKDIETDVEELGNVVRLGTIHSVKGLEFPVVFVSAIDAIDDRAASANNLLLFDPQFGNKPGFGLMFGMALSGPWAGKASFKKRLFQQIWLKPRVLAEQQRLFYVALTRAKERLYVTYGPKSPPWVEPDRYPSDAIQVICP